MSWTSGLFVALHREEVLALKEREALQRGDFRVYHLPEGGIYEVSTWQINAWTGQGFWQVEGHLTEKEVMGNG